MFDPWHHIDFLIAFYKHWYAHHFLCWNPPGSSGGTGERFCIDRFVFPCSPSFSISFPTFLHAACMFSISFHFLDFFLGLPAPSAVWPTKQISSCAFSRSVPWALARLCAVIWIITAHVHISRKYCRLRVPMYFIAP